MKKSELRQIIKEELKKILEDSQKDGDDMFEFKKVKQLIEQKINPINKFFHDLANEGEELVKKMKEKNGTKK